MREALYGVPKHAASGRAAEAWAELRALALAPAGPGGEVERLEYRPGGAPPGLSAPWLVRGVPEAEGWPAAERWRGEAAFAERYAGLEVPLTELFPVHGLGKAQKVSLPLPQYLEYAGENSVDFPYYPWERDFKGPQAALLGDFRTLPWFEDDVYDLAPDVRAAFPLTCHRFVIWGGRRTGSVVHQDPKASGAWNCCLVGRKRWCLFPPSVSAAELSGGGGAGRGGGGGGEGGPRVAGDSENYREQAPAYWWLDVYPGLRARGRELGMVECVQGPGETLYIPPGWWHAVLNVPDEAAGERVTICCTQNALTPAMLRACPWAWATLWRRWPRLARRLRALAVTRSPPAAAWRPAPAAADLAGPAGPGDLEAGPGDGDPGAGPAAGLCVPGLPPRLAPPPPEAF